MARVPDADPHRADPPIFRAVRGMWSGIDASGLIDERLKALLNRRVAFLNGCEF